MYKGILSIIYDWQQFLGAIIGASAPILFWFFIQWYERHTRRKEYLIYLEKFLVDRINNVIDVKKTIENFLDERLVELISNIKSVPSDIYSTAIAFLPFFNTEPIGEILFNHDTKSSYLDNQLLKVVRMSKDFSEIVDDIRRQFQETISTDREMAMRKLNAPLFQNEEYVTHLNNFIESTKRDLNKNIPIYFRVLVSARITADTIRKMGIIKWRFKFSADFIPFKNKESFKKYVKETPDRIDKFLEPQIETQLKKIQEIYSE